MQPKHDVFISYSRKDTDLADSLYELLESAQFDVWMDRPNIPFGADWDTEIQMALQNSRMMLLVMSQASMDSKNVRPEIRLALDSDIAILPVQIEVLRADTNIIMRLRDIQRIDATKDQSQPTLNKIVAATRKILGAAVPSVQAQTNTNTIVVAPIAEESAMSNAGSIITKTEFLAQCRADEKSYFADVLTYCEAHPAQIVIDWGGKGFSIKDSQKRQILWIFPQEGANSKSNINARLQKLSEAEKAQIMEILRVNGITKGLSWRPADLPLAEIQKIIALVCKI